VLVAMTL